MALPDVVEKPRFQLPGFRGVADKLLAHLEMTRLGTCSRVATLMGAISRRMRA